MAQKCQNPSLDHHSQAQYLVMLFLRGTEILPKRLAESCDGYSVFD